MILNNEKILIYKMYKPLHNNSDNIKRKRSAQAQCGGGRNPRGAERSSDYPLCYEKHIFALFCL